MEKTTPSNSPLHRGRNGRKETLQCNTQHILPLYKKVKRMQDNVSILQRSTSSPCARGS